MAWLAAFESSWLFWKLSDYQLQVALFLQSRAGQPILKFHSEQDETHIYQKIPYLKYNNIACFPEHYTM
jgi:hypothetical protein